MIVNRAELIKRVKYVWPKIRVNVNLFVPLNRWWLPEKKHVEAFLKADLTNYIKYNLKNLSCTDFAVISKARNALYIHWLVENKVISGDEACRWAYAEVWGTKFKGRKTSHAVNGVMCDEGFYLIEPQTDTMWYAYSTEDHVHKIDF